MAGDDSFSSILLELMESTISGISRLFRVSVRNIFNSGIELSSRMETLEESIDRIDKDIQDIKRLLTERDDTRSQSCISYHSSEESMFGP